MKQFRHEASRLSILAILSLALSFSMRPSQVKATDSAALANTVMTGAMSMAMIAATDTAGSLGDCFCQAEGAKCPMGVAGHCAMMGLNIAAMALGIAQALSAGESESAVADFDNPAITDTDELGGAGLGPPSVGGPNLTGWGCGTENESKYLCDPNGLDLALEDLNKVPTTGVNFTPEQLTAIENSKTALSALKEKDAAGAFAALDSSAGSYADTDSNGDADGGTAGDGSYLDGGADSTAGINSNYAGTASGNTLDGLGGGGKGGFGPKGALLGKTDWNGSLDAIDPRSGKSLTLWQRATRRYLGAPSGKRGFTMARIEKLRKESTPEFAEQKRKSDAIKKAALERKTASEEVAKPVILSPKALFGH